MATTATAIAPTVSSSQLDQGGSYVGFTVSWDFPKGDLEFCEPRAQVHEVFERYGFAEYIEAGDWAAASALNHVPRTGGGRLIRIEPMERPNKDTPAAMAFYKKSAGNEATGDKFSCGARVRVVPTRGGNGETCVALPLEGQAVAEADCLALAEQFAIDANKTMTHVTIKELANVLGAVGRSTLWAAYRDHGGTWFVYDSPKAKRFKDLLRDLKALSMVAAPDGNGLAVAKPTFKPRVQPLFIDTEGLTQENVKESSEAALEKDLAELVKKLDKVKADGMRQHSIERAVADCDELLARADFYRVMLEDAADEIATRINEVKAAFDGNITAERKAATKKAGSAFAAIDKAVGRKSRKRRSNRGRSAAPTKSLEELFTL